jgi:hypothetical protein
MYSEMWFTRTLAEVNIYNGVTSVIYTQPHEVAPKKMVLLVATAMRSQTKIFAELLSLSISYPISSFNGRSL